MIARPDGALLQMPVDLLKGSPFSNYLVPGLLLLTLLGVYPLVVAWAVWCLPGWNWPERLNPFETRHWSWAAALSAGCILAIWISVQLKFLGYLHWAQIAYLVWGILIIVLPLTPSMRRRYTREPRSRRTRG